MVRDRRYRVRGSTGFPVLPRTIVCDRVTREALSNCARHARATAVSISLALQDGQISLDITDNGRGLGTPAHSSGLASMRRRAENNSSTLQLTTPAGGGTRLSWTARPRESPPSVREKT
jgi:signal transduction histidine kinase